MVVIRLQTERLVLRPMGVADVDDFVALHNQPAVADFLGPATPELARERLELCQRNWREHHPDLIAVLERSSGRFVGRLGLRYWPQFDETEAGWALRREAWGRGYATEAARAVIDWGFRTFPLPYVTAMIRPDNSRSMGVARRLGLTPIRDDVLHGVPVIVHAIQRAGWGAEPAADEVERLLAHVADWAGTRDDLVAVGVVGSPGASGAELVFLSRHAANFVDAEEWAGELGSSVVLASAHRGTLIEHRLRTASGVELTIAIGPPRWASEPAADGVSRTLYDPGGTLTGPTDASA